MIASVIEIEGTLQADGQLILDEKPSLPPGRVRVTVQPVAAKPMKIKRLPDPAWLDDAISAPFDLPHRGVSVLVHPIPVKRLPEVPAQIAEDLA